MISQPTTQPCLKLKQRTIKKWVIRMPYSLQTWKVIKGGHIHCNDWQVPTYRLPSLDAADSSGSGSTPVSHPSRQPHLQLPQSTRQPPPPPTCQPPQGRPWPLRPNFDVVSSSGAHQRPHYPMNSGNMHAHTHYPMAPAYPPNAPACHPTIPRQCLPSAAHYPTPPGTTVYYPIPPGYYPPGSARYPMRPHHPIPPPHLPMHPTPYPMVPAPHPTAPARHPMTTVYYPMPPEPAHQPQPSKYKHELTRKVHRLALLESCLPGASTGKGLLINGVHLPSRNPNPITIRQPSKHRTGRAV